MKVCTHFYKIYIVWSGNNIRFRARLKNYVSVFLVYFQGFVFLSAKRHFGRRGNPINEYIFNLLSDFILER